jgi:P-type Cu+ transporter
MGKAVMSESRQKVTIPVRGMTCATCAGHVEKVLTGLPGVSDVVVKFETNQVSLTYNPQQGDVTDAKIAIENAGYQVSSAEITLDVRGMTCASCIAHTEGALMDLPGVENVNVNISLGIARVKYILEVVTPSEMVQALKDIGYEAFERSAR